MTHQTVRGPRRRPPILVVKPQFARMANEQNRRLRTALAEARDELELYNGAQCPIVRRIDQLLKGE